MKTVSMQDLLEIYRQKNHCRDIVEARTKLEKVGRDMYEHPDTEVSSKGEYLLLRLQEWDEQQAKQQVNTPPPKQKPYATPQTNGANQAPPQTNTAQAYPDGYNAWMALAELIIPVSKLAIGFTVLYIIGGVVVNALKGFGDGVRFSIERGTPYAIGVIAGCVGLLGLKEFFTKKETLTVPNGPAGYTINHYHYGNGVVTNEQTK